MLSFCDKIKESTSFLCQYQNFKDKYFISGNAIIVSFPQSEKQNGAIIMKCAIIDVGSNSIRLAIYQVKEEKFRILFTQKVTAGLAGYVEKKRLSERGIQRACEVLLEYLDILHNFHIEDYYIVATASLRNIENTREAAEEILRVTGCHVDVISGEEEACLAYIGALHNVHVESGVLVDIGGSSTELVQFRDRRILRAVSVPIGSLSLFSRFVEKILPKKKEYQAIMEEIHRLLEQAELNDYECDIVCGVGGTVRNALKLNNYLFNESAANNTVSAEHLEYISKLLANRDTTARNLILKVCPERIHTIIPGLCVLNDIMDRFGAQKLVVSHYGVREGYLYDKVLKQSEGEN